MHKYGTGEIIGDVTTDDEAVPQGLSVTARKEIAAEPPTPQDAVELVQENQEG